jgi:hypothetical protein
MFSGVNSRRPVSCFACSDSISFIDGSISSVCSCGSERWSDSTASINSFIMELRFATHFTRSAKAPAGKS